MKAQEIANNIIKIFIENNIPITQQLEILKMVKQRLDFCRNTGAELKQFKLEL